jgi:hypothetical protein
MPGDVHIPCTSTTERFKILPVTGTSAWSLIRLSVQVWNEPTFHLRNHVFQAQFLLLESADAQLVNMRYYGKFGDGDIEIAMCQS